MRQRVRVRTIIDRGTGAVTVPLPSFCMVEEPRPDGTVLVTVPAADVPPEGARNAVSAWNELARRRYRDARPLAVAPIVASEEQREPPPVEGGGSGSARDGEPASA